MTLRERKAEARASIYADDWKIRSIRFSRNACLKGRDNL